MAKPEYTEGDRIELIADYGSTRPALKKGRQGTIVTFPLGKKEREQFCFARFDRYTQGVVSVSFDKIKKI